MDYILAPSILAADFTKLGEEIKKTELQGAKYLHFDVMDGMFVPSISFGMPVLASIKKATKQVIDAHLMVKEPIRYVEAFQKAGADIVTVHLEACEDIKETLDLIKSCGMSVGISICPDTKVEELEALLPMVNMVLIMCVHPGFGGQKFIPESIEKTKKLKSMIEEKGLHIDIEVDGGIYLTNVREIVEAGANVIVAGSAVFQDDAAQNTKQFMEILRKYES